MVWISLVSFMKKTFLLAASVFSLTATLFPIARADEATLFVCIKKYTALGITPDTALSECKQKSLAGCINTLLGKDKEIISTVKKNDGYLIDLGENQDNWLEGGGWRDKGCKPYVNGASKTTRIGDPWNGEVKLEWFAQGICPSNTYNTGIKYSLASAELACKLRAIKESE
ncbi:possible Flavivirus glycoprotein, immunoglobul [Synechococcus sp. BL107]|nr:possible Flavivirus glycoprotein, immunoglobul [Synechococcus sp. BL107]